MRDKMLFGALRGRFFKCEVHDHGSSARLLAAAQELAWTDGWDIKDQIRLGLCSGAHVYSEDLDGDDAPDWSFELDENGAYRGWLLMEVRKVHKSVLDKAMHMHAMSSWGVPLQALSSQVKKEVKEEVLPRLRMEALGQKTRIPFLVHPGEGLVWVGAVSMPQMRPITLFLQRLVGGIYPVCEPVVWGTGPDSVAWSAMTTGALMWMREKSPELSNLCTITDLAMQGSSIKLRFTDPHKSQYPDNIKTILALDPPPKITKLGATVEMTSGRVRLEVDEDGLRVIDPPSSQGGFTAEAIMRRYDEALEGARELGNVLARVAAGYLDGEE